jgi:ribose transport system substrate-binding protein
MRYMFVLFICIILAADARIFAQDFQKEGNIKKVTIGVVGKSQSNPVFLAAFAGARIAAKEFSAKYSIDVLIDWRTPQIENPQEQAQAVDNLSRSGAAGIAIACSDANILTPSINKAVDHGTQVVCFDADAPLSKRFAYYGSDNAEFGAALMKELAREMNEKGVIAVIGGNKNALNLQRRVQAVQAELKKYPSMKLLHNGIFYHDEIPEKSLEVLIHAQKSNPEIGGWVLVGGWPLWVKDGIKWKPGQVKIVACDALPNELEYVKSGHAQVLLAQGCFLWGYKSVELLLKKILLKQNPADVFIADPPTRVTIENLDEWSLNWKKWMLKEAVNR